MNRQIISDKLQGAIRNPYAFYFPIQRGFSGSIQTLPTDSFWPLVRFFPTVNFIYEKALLFSDKFVIWQMEWSIETCLKNH